MKKITEHTYYPAVKVASIFLIFGIVYILFSDWLLMQLIQGPDAAGKINDIQSVKGVIFVIFTSLLLFFLIHNEINKQLKFISRLKRKRSRLDRLEAEEAKTQKDMNLIFNNSEELITIFNFEGYLTKINPAWENKLGWSEDELLGNPWIDFVHPEDVEKSLNRNRLLKQGVSTLSFVNRLRKKDHEYAYISWNTIPLIDEQLVFAIGRDITRQKRAEIQLDETKNLLQTIINNLNESVLIIAPEMNRIILVNDVFYNMFGYNRTEILGESPRMLHVDETKYNRFGKQSVIGLEKKGIFQKEYQMKKKNGEIIDTEITVTTLNAEKGWEKGVVTVIRDITERKSADRKFDEYQEELKQLTMQLSLNEEKQRKDIAANIHDHLSQSLVIAKMKLNELRAVSNGDGMRKEIGAITKHISEALDNSRKITYDLSPPILYELGLIETMHWISDKVERENNVRVIFTTQFDNLKLPDSELILLFRVIQELIQNSVKHGNPSEIVIRFQKQKNGLGIIIQDNGKGFDTQKLRRTRKKNTGFGIFNVKERIRNLSGSFFISSKIGKGTEARIFVPLNDQ